MDPALRTLAGLPQAAPAEVARLARALAVRDNPEPAPVGQPASQPTGQPAGGPEGLDVEAIDGELYVGAFVRVRSAAGFAEMEALGVQIGTVIGDIATARIPVRALGRLGDLAQVARVEASQVVTMRNDSATIRSNVAPLRARIGAAGSLGFVGYAGQGVIVGVYDTGLDYRHPDFRDTNDRSRVLALWDQTATSGTPPAGFRYGNLCDNASLTAGTCTQRDINGHGTHVAGSAAGNGSGVGPSGLPGQYAGSAPLAELMIVKGGNGSFSETRQVDGAAWLFGEAERLGRPAVINYSLGGQSGPHDGTRLAEIAFDRLSGPGKVFVISAGNDGQNQNTTVPFEPRFIHALARLTDGRASTFTFSVPQFNATGTEAACSNATAGNESLAQLDIWYDKQDQVTLTLVRPDGSELTVPYGRQAGFDPSGQGIAQIVNGIRDTTTTGIALGRGDNRAFVQVFNCGNLGSPPPGTYTLRITPTRVVSGRPLHAWIASFFPGGQTAQGGQGFDNSFAVGMPGTANRVITVGAYVARGTFVNRAGQTLQPVRAAPLGDVAPFSASGPTRDGRIKPEIVAPGVLVASALGRDVPRSTGTVQSTTPDTLHWFLSGTSMSAPITTGTVALLLQQNPRFTPEEVKALITRSARQDQFTRRGLSGITGDEGVPNNTFGFGKLDGFGALNLQGVFANVSRLTITATPVSASMGPVLSQRGARIPAIRLAARVDGPEAVQVSQMGFQVSGQDPQARLLVFRDLNGNGAIDNAEPQVGASSAVLVGPNVTEFSVTTGFTIRAGETLNLLGALELSGATPNNTPFSIAYIAERTVGTGQTSRRFVPHFEPAGPVRGPATRTTVLRPGEVFALSENPIRSGRAIFNFSRTPERARIYTLSGRLVHDLVPAIRRAGGGRVEWNLTNDQGARVAPGIYLLVVDVDGQEVRQKLVITANAGQAGGQ